MAEKVKVSREVANAIEENLTRISKEKLLKEHAKPCRWETEKYESLNDVALWEMAEILINGYEIEETPEEKLLATYERQIAWSDTNDIFDKRAHTAYANAIVFTLDTLDIKIKGIND